MPPKSDKGQNRQGRKGSEAVPADLPKQQKPKTKIASTDKAERDAELNSKMGKYSRSTVQVSVRNIQNRKLRSKVKKANATADRAAEIAARSEMLNTEEAGYIEAEGMERTYKLSQQELAKSVDMNTTRKMFDLDLETFGPYSMNYTRNGRHMIIGGRKGHVATFDWMKGKLGAELHLNETVRDVTWLHNETMFAVAQRKYAYIYDHTGAEVHCMKKHIEANRLAFLPYHFLLASVGNSGKLVYQDTSTGSVVSELATRLGKCSVMEQNPWNGVLHLGHAQGSVTLWSPTQATPLVKMLCHQGPVTDLAINKDGRYMVTSGMDGQMRVWDIRTFKPLQEYYTPKPAKSLAISQTGLLAVGFGSTVNVWKGALETKQQSPYMSHTGARNVVERLQFCPYEDVLGYGHARGISSLVIPGAGEANYDTLVANPYQTTKQRQESEVHALLEKIQPGMIQLEPDFVGKVDRTSKEVKAYEREQELAEEEKEGFDPRKRAKGKSSAMRKWLRKKERNVVDARMMRAQDEQKARKDAAIERKRVAAEGFNLNDGKEGALSGFFESMKKKPKIY